MPRTRSGQAYHEDDALRGVVGELPFQPSDIISDNADRTVYGRARIAWDFVVSTVGKWPSASWTEFLFSDPLYEEEPSRADWIPQWPLGRGGAGKVALWAKLDCSGVAQDRIAVKETFDVIGTLYDVGLVREAVFHGHMTAMKEGEDVISQLRNYKYFPHFTDSEGDRARFYLSYAPNGNLDKLRDRYRAWDRFLPELYLWSTFYDLAKATRLLRECPSTWRPIPRDDQIPADYGQDSSSFIIHRDLKPDNILVGPSRDPKIQVWRLKNAYPHAQMADFGFASVKNPQSRRRRRSFYGGTKYYYTPEQLHYSHHWPNNDLYGLSNNTYRYSETMNTFGCGRTVYSLMTLAHNQDWPGPVETRKTANAITQQDEISFNTNNRRHFLDLDTIAPAGSNYTRGLLQLIYDCLSPEIGTRPSANQLYERTKRGYETALAAAKQAIQLNPARIDDYRVFFNNGDMNEHCGAGAANFGPRVDDPRALDRHLFERVRKINPRDLGDPDEPPLQPPQDVWRWFYAREPTYVADFLHRNGSVPGLKMQEGVVALLDNNRDVVQKVGEYAYFGRRGGGASVPPPTRKRANSWDSAEEDDPQRRRELRDLRRRTRGFAGTKPVALLAHVHRTEGYDVRAAAKVLQWLYHDHPRQRYPWAENKENRARAQALMDDWSRKYPTRAARSFKECLYFGTKQSGSVLRRSLALETMNQVFNPEEVDARDNDANDIRAVADVAAAAAAAAVVDAGEMQALRQLRVLIGDHAREASDRIQQRFDDGLLRQVLARRNWVARDAFDHMNTAFGHLAPDTMLTAAHPTVPPGWDAYGLLPEDRSRLLDQLERGLQQHTVDWNAYFASSAMDDHLVLRVLGNKMWDVEEAIIELLVLAEMAGFDSEDGDNRAAGAGTTTTAGGGSGGELDIEAGGDSEDDDDDDDNHGNASNGSHGSRADGNDVNHEGDDDGMRLEH